jgi:hypothetical protein
MLLGLHAVYIRYAGQGPTITVIMRRRFITPIATCEGTRHGCEPPDFGKNANATRPPQLDSLLKRLPHPSRLNE